VTVRKFDIQIRERQSRIRELERELSMKTAKRDKELLLKQIKKLESEIYKISDQKGEAINDLHRQSVKLQEEV